MCWFDWTLVGIFLIFILAVGFYSMRFVRSVTDYLACGRVCGRYVISVADVANGLAIVVMVGAVESGYKSGFAYGFWGSVSIPLSLVLALSGFVTYRFRQTKAMSFGQFIEMRYSRGLRIFASCLRSVADMLANMILPALAGRFFICFLDLPETYHLFGLELSTFMTIMFICLALAISMILMGGSVTLVITDTIQGLIAYPVLAFFVFFVIFKFSWTDQVLPVLKDRVAGESFLNPYDVENLRDFNIFYIFAALFASVLNRGVGLGAGGGTSAAKSPHEQKMAGVLGTWRSGFMFVFYSILIFAVITFMNHQDFSGQSSEIRKDLSVRITRDLVKDPVLQQKIIARTNAIPVSTHTARTGAPLSVKQNLDTPYINVIAEVAKENPSAKLHGKVPEFKTLFHQMMLPAFLRKLLPPGLMGVFCILVILMIISTDDSRIYSASITFSQDVVLPLLKNPPSMKKHINIIRIVTICVGVFYFCGSSFMSQLEYINMFVLTMYGLWTAGAGIMVLGGLYTRFGTRQGAWASLLCGSGLMLTGVLIQRNWASWIYPTLVKLHWETAVGEILTAVSKPLNPYVVWSMSPYRCPVNAIELSFLSMLFSILMYLLVSWITYRAPFNLDRMLHRGKYNTDHLTEAAAEWKWKNLFKSILGITNEYTTGDKIIAWSVFIYSFVVGFGLFITIVIWNLFDPWPLAWWGNYYLTMSLILPSCIAVITTIWFFTGGVIDLRNMFRDLKKRQIDDLDNGLVSGNVSLSDQKAFEQIQNEEQKENKTDI